MFVVTLSDLRVFALFSCLPQQKNLCYVVDVSPGFCVVSRNVFVVLRASVSICIDAYASSVKCLQKICLKAWAEFLPAVGSCRTETDDYSHGASKVLLNAGVNTGKLTLQLVWSDSDHYKFYSNIIMLIHFYLLKTTTSSVPFVLTCIYVKLMSLLSHCVSLPMTTVIVCLCCSDFPVKLVLVLREIVFL